MKKTFTAFSLFLMVSLIAGCSPEIGTKAWCDNLSDKAKGEWTANEAAEFAKYCLLKNYKDK